MEKGNTSKHQHKPEAEMPNGISASESLLLSHYISYIINRYTTDEPDECQVWQEIPELVS